MSQQCPLSLNFCYMSVKVCFKSASLICVMKLHLHLLAAAKVLFSLLKSNQQRLCVSTL